jgi:hypothetical protein
MLSGITAHPLLLAPIIAMATLVAYTIKNASKIKRFTMQPIEHTELRAVTASIHGLYICHQCDVIFNTAYCPSCGEEGMIPLVRLTGSFAKLEYDMNKIRQGAVIETTPCNQKDLNVKLIDIPSEVMQLNYGTT